MRKEGHCGADHREAHEAEVGLAQGKTVPAVMRKFGVSEQASERVDDFETTAERIYCRAKARECRLLAVSRVG